MTSYFLFCLPIWGLQFFTLNFFSQSPGQWTCLGCHNAEGAGLAAIENVEWWYKQFTPLKIKYMHVSYLEHSMKNVVKEVNIKQCNEHLVWRREPHWWVPMRIDCREMTLTLEDAWDETDSWCDHGQAFSNSHGLPSPFLCASHSPEHFHLYSEALWSRVKSVVLVLPQSYQ